jgi:hypothetical protein
MTVEIGQPATRRLSVPERHHREPGTHPETTVPETSAVDGDASTYLEELVTGELPAFLRAPAVENALEVEVVGSHIRLRGTVAIGHFRRLSDFLNNHDGLISLRDATVLRRNGDPTKVRTQGIWLSPNEVTLIAQHELLKQEANSTDLRVAKVPRTLIVVTPGHTLTGNIYLMPEADLSVFIESADPVFLPMTDVRTRSLADRRVISRYAFAMLNRRHIVAATELQPGMGPSGRAVL